ncbi:uncharacterized protein BKA55DRAFT_655495 [Fusarium redolens]|uniref:DUF5672 domain-containing protein n=1 Tax=Fusarium redolens TaxID=48865 RepID=A0A9P9FZ77_FUSRE|nr:uncharacterized protein BKA55DRAFT_655495 [Fusarium redolens]KAH7227224.1 hypothetical protein BKA55DRAFT_655495 [Fusarium redolens]
MFAAPHRLVAWLSPRALRIPVAIATFVGILVFVTAASLPQPTLPKIKLTYANETIYNESKVALLIENRPQPIIAPLMLQFMYAMPPDWRFRFMGSDESVAWVNQSAAIREQVKAGKLDLTYIPSNMSTAGQEMISRFLTTLWLYETVLQPAEFLLVFQTDSIICANSKHIVDDYLNYDWVGAPWNPSGRWGGNGGLSLRRVSSIIDVLRNQRRIDGTQPEDVWLSERLGDHNTGLVANGSVSTTFSGETHRGIGEIVPPPECDGEYDDEEECVYESMLKKISEPGRPGEWVMGLDDWRDQCYEPMGYHIGGANQMHGTVWGTKQKRDHIYTYCPEARMILKMDFADYVPGACKESW